MRVSLEMMEKHGMGCDWVALRFAWAKHFVDIREVSRFAVECLRTHPELDDERIICLAWGEEQEVTDSILASLADDQVAGTCDEGSTAWEQASRKVRAILLAELRDREKEPERLLIQIESVYADFGYPQEMEPFISYLPPTDGYNPSFYSIEENVKRLIGLFNRFLDTELESVKQ